MCALDKDICCPQFDPEPWENQEVVWQDKLFVKDRVRCIFHIPLNFGGVMIRNMNKIETANAKDQDMIVLSHDKSLWYSDVYISVTESIPDATMTTLSGTFLSKVYEGPYQKVGQWIKDMKAYVVAQGKELKTLYTYYTTCPKCAKKYGKNYVVLLARI